MHISDNMYGPLYNVGLNELVGTVVLDTDGIRGIVDRVMYDGFDHYLHIIWMGKPSTWESYVTCTLEVQDGW